MLHWLLQILQKIEGTLLELHRLVYQEKTLSQEYPKQVLRYAGQPALALVFLAFWESGHVILAN